jgi:hypothetical protein
MSSHVTKNLPFPLHPPASALAVIAIGRLFDIPQATLVIMVAVRPIRIVGFRPNLSEARPQRIAVRHCESAKTADVIPAHFATSFLSTPKLSIISGCCHVSKVVQNRGGVTHEIGEDRSHGDGLGKPAYCWKLLAGCLELRSVLDV